MALNPGLGNIGAGASRNPLNPGLGNIGGNTRPTINPSIGNKGVPGFADNVNFYTGETYNSAVLKNINNALSDKYDEYMEKYTVRKPEYQEEEEDTSLNDFFGMSSESEGDYP